LLYNIARKAKWIKNNMPYINDAILLTNQGIKMDKGIVNMDYPGSIFIDDVKSNLDSSNAKRKILFGKRFVWNREWNGERCETWSEVGERLL
jgi:5'(3')-deoxyribonucleotidase